MTEQLAREHVLAVYGDPAPKGSLKCIGQRGRHQLVEDSARTAPWRDRVARGARRLTVSGLSGPLGLEVTLTVERPVSHYLTRRDPDTGLRILSAAGRSRPYPTKRSQGMGGDVDKLARVILDALEDAGVYGDDAQVVELTARKTYPDGPGVLPDALVRPGARIRLYPIGG